MKLLLMKENKNPTTLNNWRQNLQVSFHTLNTFGFIQHQYLVSNGFYNKLKSLPEDFFDDITGQFTNLDFVLI